MSKIILLHGLHMHSWVMKPLADMLEKQGFDVALFGYYSVWHTMQQHTQALAEFVEKHDTGEPLHFAGHSLGGLVLRHFAAAHPEKITGRIVTFGTPHQGSRAAQRVFRLGLKTPVLGGAYRDALDGGTPDLSEHIELGSIAGNKPLGLGRVLGLHGEHGGTVLVSEARCPNMRDHVILPVSHSGMLFKHITAEQTATFLREGQFNHDKKK